MAAVATASSGAANAFIAVCDRVVGLGDKYYLQEIAWKCHKRSLEGYKNEVTLWKDAASHRGLSSHPDVIKCLQVAVDSLTEAETKLKKKEASTTAIFRRKFSRTLFSTLVENKMQQVDDAFGDIQKIFKKEAAAEVLDKVVNSSVYSDCFSPDSRYVHFEETENKIVEALNDDIGGPPVVLLHGGAGKGKSTVIGNTAAYYDPERWPDTNRKFECVVVQDCGSTAPISFTELLRQLIQRLGGKPAEDEETSRSISNENRFKRLLKERKMLLILDNLDDEFRNKDFLLNIVRMGVRGLKLLIVAQLESVCKVLDPKSVEKIPIQDVDKYTARKILAVHAGFPNQEIPSNLLEYADELIAHTDCLPLALATLGGAIDRPRNDTEREWEDLCRNLPRALKNDKVPHALFHSKHPDLWSTLNLVITRRLSEGARKLLLLTHALASTACFETIPSKVLGSRIRDGPEPLALFFPCVAESVIELFYDSLLGVEEPFSDARRELYDLQLITIVRDRTFRREQIQLRKYNICEDGILWQVHSLQRLFIENVDAMRDAKNSIVDSLIRAGDAYNFGDHIIAAMCILKNLLQVEERPANPQLSEFVTILICAILLCFPVMLDFLDDLTASWINKQLLRWSSAPSVLDLACSKIGCRTASTAHVLFIAIICLEKLGPARPWTLLGLLCFLLGLLYLVSTVCLALWLAMRLIEPAIPHPKVFCPMVGVVWVTHGLHQILLGFKICHGTPRRQQMEN
ncbi:unnamed protein product [Calypogeia fissa]